MKRLSFLEEIRTPSDEVFKDLVSDMVVEIKMLCIPTRETATNNDTVKSTAGS